MQPAVVNGATEPRPENAAAVTPHAVTAWQRVRTQICIILTVGTCVIALLWLIMIDVIVNERHAAIEHARAEVNNLSAAFQSEVSQTMNSVARAMDAMAERMRAAQGQFDIHEWAGDIPLLANAAIYAAVIGPDGRLLSTTLDAHPRTGSTSATGSISACISMARSKAFSSASRWSVAMSGQTAIQVSHTGGRGGWQIPRRHRVLAGARPVDDVA